LAEPVQLPLATVDGQPWLEAPADLFIPPQALRVLLAQFEGPLDLLLWLIRRARFSLRQLPIQEITRQYLEYLGRMREVGLELAADYLLMAATLAEIKARLLLPKPPLAAELQAEVEEDPRAGLVRRLLAYERLRQAARRLDALPRRERDWWPARAALPELPPQHLRWQISPNALLACRQALVQRRAREARRRQPHALFAESERVEQRLPVLWQRLQRHGGMDFAALVEPARGARGLAVDFLAVLELARQGRLRLLGGEQGLWLEPVMADAAALP